MTLTLSDEYKYGHLPLGIDTIVPCSMPSSDKPYLKIIVNKIAMPTFQRLHL